MSCPSFQSTVTMQSGSSSPYIRLSPTAFFKSVASTTPNTPPSFMSQQAGPTIVAESTSPVNGLMATPKSHRCRTPGRAGGSNPNCARKKLCYPADESTPMVANTTQTPQSKKTMQKPSTQRTVSLISKTPKGPQAFDTLLQSQSAGRQSREKQCQSAPAVSMYDNFSTNVYATPPRHLLRRQQSASATMVSVGGGRFIPAFGHRAAVRFTPPIGEDVSTLFAGSKFSDSPSAKSLPMPPMQWLDEVKSHVTTRSPNTTKSIFADRNPLKNVTEEDPTTEEDESDDQSVGPVMFHLDSSSSDGESAKPIPKLLSQHSNVSSNGSLHDPASESQLARGVEGIRLDPLQLIAAVAAS
ncbi:proline-rich nuclear receptor coactivator motif domain-containing protein [Ditylenchus destructor]|nr:proline-rich nuclear receptor coactivator motif domain-containing protein [Ditylenchus destructor]